MSKAAMSGTVMSRTVMSGAALPKAAVVSLATSVPPNVLLQKDVLAAAWDVFGPRFPEFERFSSIFSNTGIIKRHAVKPFDWYLEPRGWPERTEAFLEGAEALFVDVAEKALASANLTGLDIDTVVTVSSTGIATPSLEAQGLRPHGFPVRRCARAGFRPRLCGWGLGAVDCLAPCAGATRQ